MKKVVSLLLTICIIITSSIAGFASEDTIRKPSSLDPGDSFAIGKLINKLNRKGKSYVVLCVDTPKFNSLDAITIDGRGRVDVGHTFLAIHNEKEDYTKVEGFYPKGDVTAEKILTKASVKGTKKNDRYHRMNGAKVFYISDKQADSIIAYMKSHRNYTYNLEDYNCSTFAIKALRYAGIRNHGVRKHKWKIPSKFLNTQSKKLYNMLIGFYGYTPANTLDDIKGTSNYYGPTDL
ncbi:hypothetical protein [Wukongibacter sp. M2B1]|uniref:hypothetical protein n=1 Tax=Wukongibacter sp. M2B1 TaxID=3088895 RepID=UPI003D7B3394